MLEICRRTVRKFVFTAFIIFFVSLGILPTFAVSDLEVDKNTESAFSQVRPLSSLILNLQSRPFTFSKLSRKSFIFAHSLPNLGKEIANSVPPFPDILIAGNTTTQVPKISLSGKSLDILTLAFKVTYENAMASVAVAPITQHKVSLLKTVDRNIAVAGNALSLPVVQAVLPHITGTFRSEIFTRANAGTHVSAFSSSVPRVAAVSELPRTLAEHDASSGVVLGAFTSSAQPKERGNCAFMDKLSLSLFCTN